MQTKVCTKCVEEKSIGMFKKQPDCRFGVRGECKICSVKIYKEWILNNRGKASAIQRRYTEKNKEKINVYGEKWARNNIEKLCDTYIKNVLSMNGFTKEQINQYPELIETKRLLIKTKRLCKIS